MLSNELLLGNTYITFLLNVLLLRKKQEKFKQCYNQNVYKTTLFITVEKINKKQKLYGVFLSANTNNY